VSTPSTWVVILAGGIGSRFWPLSTPERPKQFLPLLGEQPMLRDTVDRLLGVAPATRMRSGPVAAALRVAANVSGLP